MSLLSALMARHCASAALLVWIAGPACSSSPSRPPGLDSGASGGTNGSAGARSASGGKSSIPGGSPGTSGEAGADANAGQDESAGSAGAVADAGSGSTADGGTNGGGSSGSAGNPAGGLDGNVGPETICSATAHWVDGPALALSTDADDHLGSTSSDELSLAWTTSLNGSVTIEYADRESIAAPFGSPKQLTGPFALDRAALSPDGLALVLVAASRRGFREYTRAARGEPFELGSSHFDAFDYYAANEMPTDNAFADPVLAPDDKTFIYSEYGPDVDETIHQSKRLFSGDIWLVGATLPATEFFAQQGKRCRPTGLSADGRSLFFWDERAEQERAAFFSYQSNELQRVVDLGQLWNAQPSADCTRLYHSGPGAFMFDLFVANAE